MFCPAKCLAEFIKRIQIFLSKSFTLLKFVCCWVPQNAKGALIMGGAVKPTRVVPPSHNGTLMNEGFEDWARPVLFVMWLALVAMLVILSL